MSTYKHALVIGGTGMLAKATRHVIANSDHVSIFGRSYLRLNGFIKNKNTSRIHGDYHKEDEFIEKLNKQIAQYGMPDLFLCWMHSSGKEVFERIMRLLDESPNTEIYHVLGSAHYDPSNISKEWYKPCPNTKYRKIILGFKIDQGLSRWLFQEEISDGTIEAIETKVDEYVVGQIEPWDMRP